MNKFNFTVLILLICIVLSAITVFSQINYIYTHHGRNYITGREFNRFQSRINGTANAPFRYRILSDYVLKHALYLTSFTSEKDQRHNFEVLAISFRFAQNFTIFFLSILYFKTLRFSYWVSIVGIVLFSISMCFAFYQSDLSFYTYTELVFFILAGIIINLKAGWWIIPLTAVAALNRESAIFIPIMFFSAYISEIGLRTFLRSNIFSFKWILPFSLSVFCFFFVYLSIRYTVGAADYSESRYGDVYPGFQLLYLNFINSKTWMGLAQVYYLLPLSLLLHRQWPNVFKWHCIMFAIPWFIVAFMFGSADETRLFLVPLLIVFIPTTLLPLEVILQKTIQALSPQKETL